MGYRNRMLGTWVALLTSVQYIGVIFFYFCLKWKGKLFKSKNYSVYLDNFFFFLNQYETSTFLLS